MGIITGTSRLCRSSRRWRVSSGALASTSIRCRPRRRRGCSARRQPRFIPHPSFMKILMVASECVPLVKTGGLGDVVGALSGALARGGVEAAVALPAYGSVLDEFPVEYTGIEVVVALDG